MPFVGGKTVLPYLCHYISLVTLNNGRRKRAVRRKRRGIHRRVRDRVVAILSGSKGDEGRESGDGSKRAHIVSSVFVLWILRTEVSVL